MLQKTNRILKYFKNLASYLNPLCETLSDISEVTVTAFQVESA